MDVDPDRRAELAAKPVVGGNDNSGDKGMQGQNSISLTGNDTANSGDSFTEVGNSQSSETVNSAETWSSYEAGSYSFDSYSLSSVASSDSTSNSWSNQGNDTSTDNGSETIP